MPASPPALAFFDWVLLAVAAASVLVGLWRGFVFEVLSLAGWVAAWFAAQWASPQLAPHLPVVMAGTLASAVAAAASAAKPGETVLLSPACASFDQFRDFEHRGDAFRALVAAL